MAADASRNGLEERQRAGANEILVAAAQAFAKRGYAATSIDDVADVLGSTKGRVYHYFRTKGDIYLGIHRQALTWALEAVQPVASDETLAPVDKLHRMVFNHAMHMMERHDFIGPSQHHVEMALASEGRNRDAQMSELFKMRRTFEQCFLEVILAGIEGGDFRDADPDLLAKAVLGTVNWMAVWFRPAKAKRQSEKERIAEELATFAVQGVIV